MTLTGLKALSAAFVIVTALARASAAKSGATPDLSSCAPLGLRAQARLGQEAAVDLARAIRAAPDVATARELALEPARSARSALTTTTSLIPWESRELEEARLELQAYDERVTAAESVDEVGIRYANLVGAGTPIMDLGGGVHVGGACDYSTGEIIAIVIGFILAIIPGIILLVVLC